jgi:hypothetical protein
LELLVVVRTGRLEILDSRRIKVQNVEVDKDVFTLEITELKFAALAALKLKFRRLIADLERSPSRTRADNNSYCKRQARHEFRGYFHRALLLTKTSGQHSEIYRFMSQFMGGCQPQQEMNLVGFMARLTAESHNTQSLANLT